MKLSLIIILLFVSQYTIAQLTTEHFNYAGLASLMNVEYSSEEEETTLFNIHLN